MRIVFDDVYNYKDAYYSAVAIGRGQAVLARGAGRRRAATAQ
jgi:hypothetical protein